MIFLAKIADRSCRIRGSQIDFGHSDSAHRSQTVRSERGQLAQLTRNRSLRFGQQQLVSVDPGMHQAQPGDEENVGL